MTGKLTKTATAIDAAHNNGTTTTADLALSAMIASVPAEIVRALVRGGGADNADILPDAMRPYLAQVPQAERDLLRPELLTVFKTESKLDGYLSGIKLPATEAGPVFESRGLADLLAMPPKQWLVDQVLGAGDLVMLYGPPGSGKSFVTIDLIFSACLGWRWAGRFDVARPMAVAYAAGEGMSGLPARFKAAAEFYGVDALPGFHFFDRVPQLHRREGQPFDTAENIERFVHDWQRQPKPLDLLIVDTLHSATVGAEENSASDMGRVLDMVRYAKRELGCAAMLVHHTNKNGTAERGSSSLRGAMDTMIGLKEIGAKWAIFCEKLKDGAEWTPQQFDLVSKADSVRVNWRDPVEPSNTDGKQNQDRQRIIDVLTDLAGEPLSASAIVEATGIEKGKQIYNLLNSLVEAGDCDRKRSGRGWVYFIEPECSESEDESGQSVVSQ